VLQSVAECCRVLQSVAVRSISLSLSLSLLFERYSVENEALARRLAHLRVRVLGCV